MNSGTPAGAAPMGGDIIVDRGMNPGFEEYVFRFCHAGATPLGAPTRHLIPDRYAPFSRSIYGYNKPSISPHLNFSLENLFRLPILDKNKSKK